MESQTCSVNIGSPKITQSTAQRKFYQWILKWINGVNTSSDFIDEESNNEQLSNKPDVPALASFFQAVGFKLLSFEKHSDGNIKNIPELGHVTITIDCGTSNMRAILELGDVLCHCPDPDHVKDASFWSISGTGPTGSMDNISQKMEETGSNLLPRVSKDVVQVVHDVAYRLFDTITSQPDHNRNTNTSLNIPRTGNSSYERKSTKEGTREVGVVRSHTQPEIRLRVNSFGYSKNTYAAQRRASSSMTPTSRDESPVFQSNKPILQRQKTWDIDIDTGSMDGEPRPSPPKMTSSPAVVAELSNSLGQISLQSDCDNPKTLTEHIAGAHRHLEKALRMLSAKKASITYSNELLANQEDASSVKSAPANISPTRHKLNTSYLKGSANEPQSDHPKARRSIQPTIAKTATRRSMQFDQPNSKLAFQRRSYGGTGSTNLSLVPKPSNASNNMKTFGNIDYNAPRNSPSKFVKPPEPKQSSVSPAPKSANATRARTPSMLKPPTTILKPIPINPKASQTSKINTGIAKKSKTALSRE